MFDMRAKFCSVNPVFVYIGWFPEKILYRQVWKFWCLAVSKYFAKQQKVEVIKLQLMCDYEDSGNLKVKLKREKLMRLSPGCAFGFMRKIFTGVLNASP